MTEPHPAPAPVQVETKTVVCPNPQCKMPFDGLTIRTVAGVEQLHGGGFVIQRMELFCLRCGRRWYWGKSDKERDKDMLAYREILGVLHGPAERKADQK